MPLDDMREVAAQLEALRHEIADLKAAQPAPKPPKPCGFRVASFRATDDELRLIRAAADAKGTSVSEFIRICLSSVLGTELKKREAVPPGLVKFAKRRKLLHHDDGATPHQVRGENGTRHDAASRAVHYRLLAQQAMAEADAAAMPAPARGSPGRLSDDGTLADFPAGPLGKRR